MKNHVTLIALILFIQSCSHFQGVRKFASTKEDETFLDKKYNLEILQVESLIEQSLAWRERSLVFYQNNYQKLSQKENLSHKDMEIISNSAKEYLKIRNELLAIARRHALGLGESSYAKITIEHETKITEIINPSDDNNMSPPRIVNYNYLINPTDDQGKELIYRLKIALAAATVLYDNFMIGIHPYEKNWKIRRLVNDDNIELKNQLEKTTSNFFDFHNRIEYYKSAKFYEDYYAFQLQNNIQLIRDEKYFDQFLNQSPIYQFMIKGKNISDYQNSFKAFKESIFDRVKFLKETSSHYASKVFGNTMGLFASRRGKLVKLSLDEKNSITNKLQPLDILLEKTPFRLTDKFIPGHYGHVAIWVGTEADLKALNLWEHPLIKSHQEAIRNGHHIIEALRPGVEINTLDHFLNIDDLLVLRHENLSQDEKLEFITRAFKQIGKAYDFNFDVETDKKIVCSEIVYVVFHNIDWPTEKTLGRFTISPDNVAIKATDNGPLHPVLMYQDGIKINDQEMQLLLESNLKEK